ncbi:Similar to lcc2: Laccase-2 (Botryotinia fuckeliana) [Cotesia congregata]|uniref:Similar to lcc2: Laccase-2 (Botryotinia fuckeliana) n=1 Tax=Cotesia congregata TaxID=51543 RepID=A0A8J2MQ03_COTCN|nr:Similar to lcc2: Laccase-2 (Botryotinia fuckeliana) [Cotesia congregata]
MTQLILKIILFLYLYGISSSSFRSKRFETVKNISNNYIPAKEEIIGGQWHPCYRNCDDKIKRTCKYTFVLKQYTSMSYACRDCPFNKEDCFLNGCITAGGHVRPVTVANHMLPGPSIQVCEGDTVIVNVINNFASDSATIHWHGIHQVDTPFMDGVPFITQCPILPHNNFVYKFNASPAGTHIWHSHIGFEEADGLYGSLIVRKPNDPLNKYYDNDLAEHVMTIWHWYEMSTVYKLATVLHRYSKVYGYSFLINGLSSKAKYISQNTSYETPKEIFHVNEGKKYRFRVMFNSPIYCPVQVSVDNHQLLVIASESGVFEPVLVDSFFINAGERYDFVLYANQRPDNYWIRYRGRGDCDKNGVRISEVAILSY